MLGFQIPSFINRYTAMLGICSMLCWSNAQAQYLVETEGEDDVDSWLWLPYVFYTDTMGTSFGLAMAKSGWLQPQSSLAGTVYLSENGSEVVYLAQEDYQINQDSRWFVSSYLSFGQHNTLRGYFTQDIQPEFESRVAGSNDSEQRNFLQSDGYETVAEIRLSYSLPWGDLEDDPLATYYTIHGLLANEPAHFPEWNPLTNGRTKLHLETFLHNRSYDINNIAPEKGSAHFYSNGIITGLSYDNRDYEVNPSKGTYQSITWQYDPGLAKSSSAWNTLTLDFRQYLPTNLFSNSQQEVLALRQWWADTPSWEETSVDGKRLIENRPPHYMGVFLGGYERMRAYPRALFNDRSGVYDSAEYSIIPSRQFTDSLPIPKFIPFDWLQFNLFAELGNVNKRFNLEELHSNLKTSYGFGLAASAGGAIARVDFAFSDETNQLWFIIGQTF